MDSGSIGRWSWGVLTAVVAGLVAVVPVPAAAGRIDVHAHANVGTGGTCPAVGDLITAMDGAGVEVMILMPTPFSVEATGQVATADLEACFPEATYGDRIKLMYGGAELNTLLHAAGRYEKVTSSARWFPEEPDYGLYPNGCPGGLCDRYFDGADTAIQIENEVTSGSTPRTYYDEFVALAEAAASSGRYLGFGEIGALHYSLYSGHPYIHFPVNHAWMKKLVDIAAAAPTPMVIDLHVEMTADTKTELEELLRHNRSVNIVLEHAGWSTYGTATAAILSHMMAAHSNLYLALKRCSHATPAGMNACYVDSTPSMVAEWVTLITTYADRIMIGTDAKYWVGITQVETTMTNEFGRELQAVVDHFDASDPAVSTSIQSGTARALFGLP